jgi:hypothetical protein
MGRLLKKGELIAIDEDLHDADAVLQRLKASELWKEAT